MTPTLTLPLPTVSADVRAFALERGVEAYLDPLLAAARRVWPHSRIEVLVEDDPELSYNRQIVFDADMNGRSADEQSAAHRQWTDELFRCCPAAHAHVFCLVQR